MEQALVLAALAASFTKETVERIRAIEGVASANLLYGPYDLYAILKAEDMKVIRDTVTKIRETPGIKSTITCNVIKPQ